MTHHAPFMPSWIFMVYKLFVTRLALVLAICATAGCAAAIERINGFEPRLSDTKVVLHGHALTVHLSATGDRSGPLVLYATGDAGWFGRDKEIFNKLVPWGHPLAAFSAREYVHHLGPHVKSVPTDAIGADYAAIVDAALTALHLPASQLVVLVGKSRGAGLEVAAALFAPLQPRLAGVLAIGLTREEEFANTTPRTSDRQTPSDMLLVYDALPALAMPVVVIQSTRDDYVPAARARTWFGPDTPTRRLVAIESGDHNFAGARPEMYELLRRNLDWLCGSRGGLSADARSRSTRSPRGTRAADRPGDR